MVRMVLLVCLAVAVTACATHAQRRRMLPLELAAADGSWRGTIRDGGLSIAGGPKPLTIARAQVLSAGRNSVLLNSSAPGGRYVSLLVEEIPCRAGHRRSAFTATVWISENYPKLEDGVTLTGCAFPRGPARQLTVRRARAGSR